MPMPKSQPQPQPALNAVPSSPNNAAVTSADRVSRSDQALRWQYAFGTPMPPRLHYALAADCLMYEQQVQAARGLSRDAERALAALLPLQVLASISKPKVPRRFKPGTRLLRTWQGRTYTVTVIDPGFLFAGRTYRSLSVIAREITGTSWSGPAFFGLLRRRTHAGGGA
jgi:hypothetical protein